MESERNIEIIEDHDGKKYLYDMVNITKEASKPHVGI